MWYAWGKSEMNTTFLSQNLKERGHLGEIDIDRIILEWILNK
jgi:hypothetical protein